MDANISGAMLAMTNSVIALRPPLALRLDRRHQVRGRRAGRLLLQRVGPMPGQEGDALDQLGKACSRSRPRPSGSSIFTGQRIRPPGSRHLARGERGHHDRPRQPQDQHRHRQQEEQDADDVDHVLPRAATSRLVRMSMRTCSLRRKV